MSEPILDKSKTRQYVIDAQGNLIAATHKTPLKPGQRLATQAEVDGAMKRAKALDEKSAADAAKAEAAARAAQELADKAKADAGGPLKPKA